MKYVIALVSLLIWCGGCKPDPNPYASNAWIDPVLLEEYPSGWRASERSFYVDICFTPYKENFDALLHVMDPLNSTVDFMWDVGTVDQNEDIPWIICDFEPIGDWIGASWGGRGIRFKMEWLEKEKDAQLIKHVILHEIWHQFGVGHVDGDGMALMQPVATSWNIITKSDLDAWTALYGTEHVDFTLR